MSIMNLIVNMLSDEDVCNVHYSCYNKCIHCSVDDK